MGVSEAGRGAFGSVTSSERAADEVPVLCRQQDSRSTPAIYAPTRSRGPAPPPLAPSRDSRSTPPPTLAHTRLRPSCAVEGFRRGEVHVGSGFHAVPRPPTDRETEETPEDYARYRCKRVQRAERGECRKPDATCHLRHRVAPCLEAAH